jgi:hypothetical protein
VTNKNSNVYQFKITLKGIQPKIWRRIQVPLNYSFWDLHVAIQDAMGWLDYHMHEFEISNPRNGVKDTIGTPDDEGYVIPGNKVKISTYFFLPKDKALYIYDFGDYWEHEILLEKIVPALADADYPLCIGGKRACPPEDCGGPWGYENLLKIISNPEHEDYKTHIKWVGGKFDPETFDAKSVRFEDPKMRWKIAFD